MRVNSITKTTMAALVLGLAAVQPAAAQQMAEPAVKQDGNGRCLDKTHEAYDSVKLFMPFRSMADCIRAGGRKAD